MDLLLSLLQTQHNLLSILQVLHPVGFRPQLPSLFFTSFHLCLKSEPYVLSVEQIQMLVSGQDGAYAVNMVISWWCILHKWLNVSFHYYVFTCQHNSLCFCGKAAPEDFERWMRGICSYSGTRALEGLLATDKVRDPNQTKDFWLCLVQYLRECKYSSYAKTVNTICKGLKSAFLLISSATYFLLWFELWLQTPLDASTSGLCALLSELPTVECGWIERTSCWRLIYSGAWGRFSAGVSPSSPHCVSHTWQTSRTVAGATGSASLTCANESRWIISSSFNAISLGLELSTTTQANYWLFSKRVHNSRILNVYAATEWKHNGICLLLTQWTKLANYDVLVSIFF